MMKHKNKIIIKVAYAELVLVNRLGVEVGRALIDLDDVEKVSKYKWHLTEAGYVAHKCKTQLLLHRFLMNPGVGQVVDHKSRNKLDNRKRSLRITNQAVNAYNSKLNSKNTSGGYRCLFFKK